MVYLRAGYSPDDYPTDAHWDAREKLERCSAAKCPSVAFQLAGAKKASGDLQEGVELMPAVHPDQAARGLRRRPPVFKPPVGLQGGPRLPSLLRPSEDMENSYPLTRHVAIKLPKCTGRTAGSRCCVFRLESRVSGFPVSDMDIVRYSA